MQLSRFSDLSLRTLMYLGVRPSGEWSTVREIAEAYDVSPNHLAKVAQWLAQEAYLQTRRGRAGGMRLRLAPDEIDLGTVVRCAETDTPLVECFDPATDQCRISGVCRLQGYLEQAEEAFFAALDGVTLADLLHRPATLVRLLRPA